MLTSIIAAVARNGVIGRDNRLLWRLRSDLRRFRALTLGKPLIMGRRTYDSIGQPLPGRHTVVLTRDTAFAAAGVRVAHDLEGALALAQDIAATAGASEIMIGGGAEIYAEAMPRAHRLYVTWVDLAPEGDARFPDMNPAEWRETRNDAGVRGHDDEADFRFVDYERR